MRKDRSAAGFEDILGINPYTEDFSRIVALVSALAARERAALVEICNARMATPDAIRQRADRVSLCRVAVALLPDTLPLIDGALARSRTRWDFEMHFTLFCYLDQVQHFPSLSSVKQEILRVVESYLLTVTKSTARAAWMAGDLVGGHWNAKEGLPVLKNLLSSAASLRGKRAAIHGFDVFLERTDTSPTLRSAALDALEQSRVSSRDRRVRQAIDSAGELRDLMRTRRRGPRARRV